MKQCISLISLTFLLLCASTVQAENNYLEVNLGYNALDDIHFSTETSTDLKYDGIADFDDGYFYGLTFGYEVNPYRFAAEISYTENTINNFYTQLGLMKNEYNFEGNVNAKSAMFCFFRDYHLFSTASPYLGIGLGSTNLEIDGWDQRGYFFNDSTAVFTYLASAGLLIHLTEKIDINLSYRYMNTNDFTLQQIIEDIKYRYEMNYETNLFLAGIKFSY
ncbi:MAG: outer membrane beta-barrel protein [Desulfobulbaceae bacterium]|nr:outer membrane beta-barrel protein [Desulfobulbaceae bacterium]